MLCLVLAPVYLYFVQSNFIKKYDDQKVRLKLGPLFVDFRRQYSAVWFFPTFLLRRYAIVMAIMLTGYQENTEF